MKTRSRDDPRKLQRMRERGWFATPDRPGDRTLEQQMTGLDRLIAHCPGKRILDVGCAEGLIAIELRKHGAAFVRGLDRVASHIERAPRYAGELGSIVFEVQDAQAYRPQERYDIVLLLAVLHKLHNPSAACATLVAACDDMVVIRMASRNNWHTIVDARSNSVPHRIDKVMERGGFKLEVVEAGPFAESTVYWRRT